MKAIERTSESSAVVLRAAAAAAIIVAAIFFGIVASAVEQGERLVGTVEGGPVAGAVLDDPGSGQSFYRVNDMLPNGLRLVKVFDDHILMRAPDGSERELYTTAGAPGPSQPVREDIRTRHADRSFSRATPLSRAGRDKAAMERAGGSPDKRAKVREDWQQRRQKILEQRNRMMRARKAGSSAKNGNIGSQ